MGAVTFDYGNNIRTFAFQRGVKDAYDFPGFVPAYIRPLFCEGRGPFRWVALSGEPSDIAATDDLVLELFPDNKICAAGLTWRANESSFRAFRRASVGWVTANARNSGWP